MLTHGGTVWQLHPFRAWRSQRTTKRAMPNEVERLEPRPDQQTVVARLEASGEQPLPFWRWSDGALGTLSLTDDLDGLSLAEHLARLRQSVMRATGGALLRRSPRRRAQSPHRP